MSFMKYFDHLKIQMNDVVSATNNFDTTNVIGCGGFGKVYKGELCSPEGLVTVAFKQLDRRLGQGKIEFWKEVMMLSRYKHENLISLMYFCIEGDEMILGYEYACRGSLDRYLSDAITLTWMQRLKICCGVAHGLRFLHDPKKTQQRVLHRDIKSANILLDEKWTAKVSDLGLSKIGPANQAHTYVVSHGVGTPGYCDPLYLELGFLSKESDVYSFGVVLFEILCGRLCTEYHNGELTKILVPMWRQCYDEKRLDKIILPDLREQMDPGSLKSFSAIAYKCLKKVREERPTMAEIVKELEFSLRQQEIFDCTNPVYRISLQELLNEESAESSSGKFKNWQKGVRIGKGVFGSVYEGYNESGNFFAVKEVSLHDQGILGKQGVKQLEREIALLSQFNHENIVRYLGTDKDDEKLYIFLELVTKGSLEKLYQNYVLRESQVLAYTSQILSGLKYLHERKVAHRDIKCANILVDASGSVKLADFGLAKATTSKIRSCKGTSNWMAPEVVRRKEKGYGLPCDIWSVGCTVLEMLTRRIPYSNLEPMRALFRIGKGELPPISNELSTEARDFILQCLRVNPDDRPTAAQLLEHPFLKRPTSMDSALDSASYSDTQW